ncbi:MAG: hypothetical protein HRU25_03240 [Psychrobium sp.]|nr:hypothetical protein [Psychrobium sp.]
MSEVIKTLDEYNFPTFASVMYHSNRVLQGETVAMPEHWNNSMVHWLFALVMASLFGMGSWKYYELNKVKPETLYTSDYRVISNLHKGVDHLRNRFVRRAVTILPCKISLKRYGSTHI